MAASPADLELRGDLDSAAWDRALAGLGGHPLQSALWGDARRRAEGIADHRWIASVEGRPAWMIRIEERRLPFGAWIGWVPRGPTGASDREPELMAFVAGHLRREGMRLLVTSPWRQVSQLRHGDADLPRTIWIDLTAGEDRVWQSLHPKLRWAIRRAARGGITCSPAQDRKIATRFAMMCAQVGEAKGVELRAHEPLIQALLAGSEAVEPACEAVLLVSTADGMLASGLFLMRVGRSFHQIWSATDREFQQERAGEAVQWTAMQWGIQKGCTLYDLEGIDPKRNKSVYDFKVRLGGNEVTLEGKQYFPVGPVGRSLAWMDRLRS